MRVKLTRFPKLFDPAAATPFWVAVGTLTAILLLTLALINMPRAPRKPASYASANVQDEAAPKPANLSAAAPTPRPTSVPAVARGFLRVASWNLEGVPAAMSERSRAAQRTSWRTSFGSERSTPPPRVRREPDADVMLLQDIPDASTLRRSFFPALRWHLIVPASSASGMTGIAIRARPGLRITAREYFPSIDGAVQNSAGADLLIGTAVRVFNRGRTFWLASFSLPPDCSEAPKACPARVRLSEWQADKRQRGESVVVGGSLAQMPVPSGAQKPLCGRQVFRADIGKTDPLMLSGDRLAGTGSGCALAIDLVGSEPK